MRRTLFPHPSQALRLLIPLVVLLHSLVPTTHLQGAEAPQPPTGAVPLASGRTAHYTIHFDRNSLRDILRHENALVALTSSGVLVRFEFEGAAVRWVRDRIGREEVTCLGRGEGDAILAGLTDGRVCRVDPTTLNLTDVAKLSAPPCWLGWSQARRGRPAGLVAVLRPTRPIVRKGRQWDVPYAMVHDLATGKTFSQEKEATAVLLDREGRVWLGADNGEWGGTVTKVDLIKGTVEPIQPPPSRDPTKDAFWEGVYGFIELSDGQVWAYGGTSHMGINAGVVTRVDSPKSRVVFSIEPSFDSKRKPAPNLPFMPITHIINRGDGLCVFSFSDVFHVDKPLKSWKKVATLDLTYRWGRPNAVGAYPSVGAVLPPRHAEEPYVLATVADGVVILDGKKATSHALPGQLGASDVARIVHSSEGSLFFEFSNRTPAWRLRDKGWELAHFAPLFDPVPEPDNLVFEKDEVDWSETCILVGPDGSISTVNGTNFSDGTRTTAHWRDGKAIQLGREVSSLSPSDSFVTADGTLWNASYNGLMRFEQGRWHLVKRRGQEETPQSSIRSLNPDGPPWVLLARDQKALWQLSHAPAKDNPRLERLKVDEGGKSLDVSDAILETDGVLLLATNLGLRRYTISTQKLARADLPEPPEPATTLVRDGLGRLWVGNEQGLWLAEAGAPEPEAFDQVPWISQGRVQALASDPRHADGVIVALDTRGVVYIRADSTRKP